MNILIIDDEIYLAQKVMARLMDEGHNCESYSSAHEVLNRDHHYDAVLLSTNLAGCDREQIIKKYNDSIIILLVSYISDATVTNPIKAGAKDYVVKPFIMDELIRKIHHFEEFKRVKKQAKLLNDYFDFVFEDIDIEDSFDEKDMPILVETNDQRYADRIVFEIAKRLSKQVRFVSLGKNIWQDILEEDTNEDIFYFTDYHVLKKSSKELFLSAIENRKCIICSMEEEQNFTGKKIEVKNDNQILTNENIMTINDYVKLMVLSFQSKYPDTELSKKLGISRKSLWEKRKKLGIEKKK